MKGPLLGLGAVFVLGLLAAGVFAFGGFRNEEAKAALETGDYDAFVTAAENAQKERLPSEDQFNAMVERHAAMQSHREAVEAAINAGDYAAWKEAMENKPKGQAAEDVITEENFPTFVKMHEARQSGDVETADALAKELGINGRGFGMGKGSSRGRGPGDRGGCPMNGE
jgi:hypothetical protein